jgi:serine/threonine protein kinase
MNLDFYCYNILNQTYQEYNIEHVGYTQDSLVYYLESTRKNKNKLIIKCFKLQKDSYEYDVNLKLINKENEVSGLIQPLNVTIIDLSYLKENSELKICFIEYPFYKYDLESYLEKNPRLSLSSKLKLIKQIENGINHLHSIGYYHGDLKPKNICISEDGQIAKIIDYGLCDKIDNVEAKLFWKNTLYSASPFQLFRHLQEYPDYKNKYYEKYVSIFTKKYNKDIYWTFGKNAVKESTIKNDWFGVGLLIYYILSGGKNFFLTTNSKYTIKNNSMDDDAIEETFKNGYDFLNNPTDYCKNIKIKNSEYYEKYILQNILEH